MQISVSELNLYLRCPRAFKLRAIDGVEPERKGLSECFSSAIRNTIGQLHGGEKRPQEYSREEIDTICGLIWQGEAANPRIGRAELETVVVPGKPGTKKRPVVAAVTRGEQMLANLTEWCFSYAQGEIASEVAYSNVHFHTTIGDATFTGRIDLVRRHPQSGMQVVCFETGIEPVSPPYLERSFAISLYVHALWQGTLYPNFPNMGEEVRLEMIPSLLVYPLPAPDQCPKKSGKEEKDGNPLIPVNRTREMLLHFEYEVLYATAGIEQEFFPMRPSSRCARCEYAYRCNGTATGKSDVSFDVEEFEKSEACKEATL